MKQYSTNLTDKQWQVIEKIINPQERKRKHQLRDIMDTIHSLVRKMTGREESPSMGIIDSRSVKTSHHVDSDRGIDGNKRFKGRKEHIVAVHEANLHDSKGAPKVVEKLEYKFPRLRKILADGGYQGSFGDRVFKKFGWVVEVVLRPDERPGKFQVIPRRWIVERTFS